MGQIITKKRTSLEDNSLEMLMRISYHKNPLRINDVKRVLDNWIGQKERRNFLVICESKKPSFHWNIFSKFAFLLKYKLLQVYYGAQKWPFYSWKLKFFKQVWNDFLQTLLKNIELLKKHWLSFFHTFQNMLSNFLAKLPVLS